MSLGRIIAGGDCGENDCPTIAVRDDGMLNVQGYDMPEVETPEGERVVAIPTALILEAARALGK
ncbi:hypothetical protein F8566_21160 [Actinomadura rudentiformis]|uniref:Uncharacterized protein n=1 Tax=Actinomadura rudentiformis TaxID=359158 RepID=A0A6H9YKE2_9ACTN|nr:hypothetical protein F8566_21160 [Actinomadura rudentiformis]